MDVRTIKLGHYIENAPTGLESIATRDSAPVGLRKILRQIEFLAMPRIPLLSSNMHVVSIDRLE